MILLVLFQTLVSRLASHFNSFQFGFSYFLLFLEQLNMNEFTDLPFFIRLRKLDSLKTAYFCQKLHEQWNFSNLVGQS
ncbi:unnamed protein product [Coffea canephora]|uniref:Uncharacterized protein n=1 Tax=Coffea canephora TaxID=49390 RepID=A0A068U6M2_COFCA|nr:unnamed protein product [Coffea canephora]